MSAWVEHLLWFDDGRIAKHLYFKFVVYNMIMRKRALERRTYIVGQYFDLRTQSYFQNLMGPVFGVDFYWYRQNFALSRGMAHWHDFCWRSYRESHDLLHSANTASLSEEQCADKLSLWARVNFGLTANNHPSGKDETGCPNKKSRPPRVGTAPTPPEEDNTLLKLLLVVSCSLKYLLRINYF